MEVDQLQRISGTFLCAECKKRQILGVAWGIILLFYLYEGRKMREQGSVLLLALCLEEGCDVCSDDVVLCPNCGDDGCLHDSASQNCTLRTHTGN